MSLHPQEIPPIPEETMRVARAAFPRGNVYMRMRDELGTIYEDQLFVSLFPARGQSAEAPWRLAFTTAMQFAEGLSDRQAADAVRSRIDWKYALSLDLTDSGFDHTVLSEFRTRLLAGGAEQLLLDTLLARLRERGLLKARGRQRTDSTHVLAAIRALNRLERVGETLRHALNSLAAVAPDWLRAQVPAAWFDRYGPRMDTYRLPRTAAAREELAAIIGPMAGGCCKWWKPRRICPGCGRLRPCRRCGKSGSSTTQPRRDRCAGVRRTPSHRQLR